MKNSSLLFFFLLVSFKPILSQVQLSVYSEISIVTAGPGDNLYEAFGHSAIRIKDPVLNLDLIYNYGVFDYNTPNFYSNFAKGNLIYSLVRYDFKYFLASYKSEKRWVKQQVLNLSQPEKQAYFTYLENNAKPENANYLYDPFFNNCATVLRDISTNILGDKLVFNAIDAKENQTLRALMDKELYWNTWGSFGINLIAGTILDKKTTLAEYMYLPDYVYLSFKNATLNANKGSEKLIKREDILANYKEIKPKTSIFNPFLIFSILALIGIFITYKNFKNGKRSKKLDFIIFFTTGLIGCILTFLWLFSSHSTSPNNFNILWAFAPNSIVAFQLLKATQPKWVQKYIHFTLLLIVLIPTLWVAKIQFFPFSILPILILLLVRYFFLINIKTVK